MPPLRIFANLGLFVRERFLSGDECKALAVAMLAESGEHAKVFGETGDGAVAPEVRRAWEIDVAAPCRRAVEQRLCDLRPALEAHFRTPLLDPDAPAYLRYAEGGFYRPHRDRRKTPDPSGAERRAVSVVVFVNGPLDEPGFAGGQLRFYGMLGSGPLADMGIDAEPQSGTLIAFPSTLLHEVTAVERGVRLTLATWLNEPRNAEP
jgi:predicted 2-oxoglutarate/Fe(II)-dependent dioxygenase YbiX